MGRDRQLMSSFTDDLLSQASALLSLDPQKPKQANLRRAVSTAYYALFHYLIEETTQLIVGTANGDKQMRQLVGRTYLHRQMKEVSTAMTLREKSQKPLIQPFWRQYTPNMNPKLVNVSTTFADLQEERHRADYDLSRPFTRQEAATAVARVQSALTDWDDLRRNNRDLARFYAFCLLCWGSWKGR